MDAKLEYLREFNKNIKIIGTEHMENHLCNIPEKWKQIIVENDFTVKKDRVIKLWNTVAKMELRNTIQYLSDHLVSLDLLYDGYTPVYNF